MKLGGEAILQQFESRRWHAYRHVTKITMDELSMMVGPNSVDVSLHDTLLFPKAERRPGSPFTVKPIVDPRNPEALQWRRHKIEDHYLLEPHEFCLGAVRERFECSNPAPIDDCLDEAIGQMGLYAPMYEGRSTCGRLGLASHVTAGFGDYGFSGSFTLEIVNHSAYAIKLYPAMRIGQVAFDRVIQPKLYKGAYSGANHNDGPVPPQLGPKRF